MAAHRYWRAINLFTAGFGSPLELSCFYLLDSVGLRLDATAILSASSAPSVGVLANLQDGNLDTRAAWTSQATQSLALVWDFGGSADVSDIRLAGDSPSGFLLCAKIQWSDDAATWATLFEPRYIKWPGKQTFTTSADYTSQWLDMGLTSYVVFSGDKRTVTTGTVSTTVIGVLPKAGGVLQFEVQILGSGSWAVGILPASVWKVSGYFVNASLACSYNNTGGKYVNGVSSAYGASFTANDVVGVVVDFTVGIVTFYKNGVSQGAITLPATLLNMALAPGCGDSGSSAASFRLAGRGFAYPIAGADPWESITSIDTHTRAWNQQSGVVTPAVPVIGMRYPKIYGLVAMPPVSYLSVATGNTPDFKSGVLGTGRGRVSGTVKEKGTPNVPVYRKVRLQRERDGLHLREVWSHPVTGAYSFDFVDELQLFTVLSYDHTGVFRAVVANGVTPELIL